MERKDDKAQRVDERAQMVIDGEQGVSSWVTKTIRRKGARVTAIKANQLFSKQQIA